MANVAASLAVLAGLAAALVLAGPGGGADPAGGDRLEPGVALRLSTAAPARVLPQALSAEESRLDPAIAATMRRSWSAIEEAGVDPRGDLLAPLSFMAISVERSCPPPALLACRPGMRVVGRLGAPPPAGLERDLEAALVGALGAAGPRGLVVHRSARSELGGRISSRGETLARWRRGGTVIEVVTGGLELGATDGRHQPALPIPDGAASSGLTVETDAATLAALLR